MQTKPAVLVTRPIDDGAVEALRRVAEVHVLTVAEAEDRPTLLASAEGKTAILALLTERIDDELLERAGPQLGIVANMAVGYDNIDVAAATARRVLVTNTPGVLDEATADLAMALLLAAARRVAEGDRFVRAGRFVGWRPDLLTGHDVFGRTLGIIGAGRIGSAVARRAALGFGMPILYCARSAKPELERELGATRAQLDDLLRQSDFVSLHVPLDDTTRHMLDATALSLMPSHAVLVNTARGPVIDEAALVSALRERRIAAAGLDVYEHEPKLAPGLSALDNVVLLPHLGSATVETRRRMAELAARNILAFLRDERPPAVVNGEVLDDAG